MNESLSDTWLIEKKTDFELRTLWNEENVDSELVFN